MNDRDSGSYPLKTRRAFLSSSLLALSAAAALGNIACGKQVAPSAPRTGIESGAAPQTTASSGKALLVDSIHRLNSSPVKSVLESSIGAWATITEPGHIDLGGISFPFQELKVTFGTNTPIDLSGRFNPKVGGANFRLIRSEELLYPLVGIAKSNTYNDNDIKPLGALNDGTPLHAFNQQAGEPFQPGYSIGMDVLVKKQPKADSAYEEALRVLGFNVFASALWYRLFRVGQAATLIKQNNLPFEATAVDATGQARRIEQISNADLDAAKKRPDWRDDSLRAGFGLAFQALQPDMRDLITHHNQSDRLYNQSAINEAAGLDLGEGEMAVFNNISTWIRQSPTAHLFPHS